MLALASDGVGSAGGADLLVEELAKQFNPAVLEPVELLDVLQELLGEHGQVGAVESGLGEDVDDPVGLERLVHHLGEDAVDLCRGKARPALSGAGELDEVGSQGDIEADVVRETPHDLVPSGQDLRLSDGEDVIVEALTEERILLANRPALASEVRM